MTRLWQGGSVHRGSDLVSWEQNEMGNWLRPAGVNVGSGFGLCNRSKASAAMEPWIEATAPVIQLATQNRTPHPLYSQSQEVI